MRVAHDDRPTGARLLRVTGAEAEARRPRDYSLHDPQGRG